MFSSGWFDGKQSKGGATCYSLIDLSKDDFIQDQANNANSAFVFMINLLIIQGCQSDSVGRGGQGGQGGQVGQVGQVGLVV